MKLVLLRHATRSAFDLESGPAGESPLNSIGLAQAEDLLKHLSPAGPLPTPTRLFVSPKLRARQTLTPLSRETALQLEVDLRLDERKSGESVLDFNRRINSLFGEIISGITSGVTSGVTTKLTDSDVVYLCTHMDWLEAVTTLWPNNLTERETSLPWSPLEYQVFRLKDGLLSSVVRGQVQPRF